MATTVHSKKQKGRRLEQWWQKSLEEAGLDIFGYVRADSGSGLKKDDVATNFVPIFSECKNQENWKPLEWYQDAYQKNTSDKTTVLILGKNRLMPFVFLDAYDFIKIMKFAKKGGWYDMPDFKFPKPTSESRLKFSKFNGKAPAQTRYKTKIRNKIKARFQEKNEQIEKLGTADAVNGLVNLGKNIL